MEITRLSDVITPSIFTDYVTQQTMEKSDLLKSGILSNSPEFDALAEGLAQP